MKRTEPEFVPASAGLKSTAKVHDAPEASDQVLVEVKKSSAQGAVVAELS